eukprot:CAMPEP_0167759838 /NCGR_PEP_ID=MMETSP0110_2-20121227/11246_1 /TAXON_ID=629695 /ORGANISM="Gymnochlora sp., Strain CCMP2014" /LENGTH=286 /DNA_ID=CAMNT_0007646269 /DNA_START=470 /DNA_END=1330 /DNA_ORIENTATION=-
MQLTQTERFLKECNHEVPSQKQCTICIESCVTPVRLACGHEFCWECLARAVLNDIKTCPLCRSEQSLNPVDLNITAILGAVDAHKYFPSNVDPSEIKKRSKEQSKGTQKKKMKVVDHKPQNKSATNLIPWIENSIGSCEERRQPVSPTSESEPAIHFELDGKNPPHVFAVVLERTSPKKNTQNCCIGKCTREECSKKENREATYMATNNSPKPRMLLDLSKELNPIKSSFPMKMNSPLWGSEMELCDTTIPKSSPAFEDWINDMVDDGLSLQNLDSVYNSAGPIKV